MESNRPKVAVFDFTDCEGCELQLVNKEDTLVDFLKAIELVNFREAMTEASDDYDIAFIEGSITRADEIERLLTIRQNAKILVALGSCACFGGVNRQKNKYSLSDVNREVYGNISKESFPVRSVKELVKVDFEIPGCPINKEEVERIVQCIIWEVEYQFPVYPVCFECKQRFTICRFDIGELCLGPVTAGGCDAPCPAGGLACWGCRGICAAPNIKEYMKLTKDKGFTKNEIFEKMDFFGGFRSVTGSK